MVRKLGIVVITAIFATAFWILYFGLQQPAGTRADGTIEASGDKARVDGGSVTVAEGVVVGPSGLAVPVAGVAPRQLVDTFTQARAGGTRVHDAIDIMAPEGTPVVAAASGTVEKLFFSPGGGGISAYVRSDDGYWIYYYAHLKGYIPGLAEGQGVRRGQVIGFVGYTGNASPDGPHLHFAINRMANGEKWHQGSPINPYPLLAGKPASR